jgi:Cytochrome c554 and c-prime
MSKQALVTLPLLAVSFVALLGCPAGQKGSDPPADHSATADKGKAGESDGNHDKAASPAAVPGDEIFVGWPKPKLAIVITGEMNGYLEPCGCAGLENQKGGLARRHTFLKQLEKDGWPLVAVDLGGAVGRYGRQAELQYQLVSDALAKMGYAAVGFGPKDLRLPEGLAAVVANDKNHQLIAANVSVLEQTQPFRVVEAGGMKVGITSILGEEYCKSVKNDLVAVKNPRTALAEIVPQMQKECDYMILLSNAKPEESETLAKEFPQFDVVVTGGGAEVPDHLLTHVDGTKTVFVELGHKGMYAIVLGLPEEKDQPPRYQRVPLDARFADSPDMKKLMADYQEQLKQMGFEGLGIREKLHPRAHAPGDLAGQFIGSAMCGECHKTAYDIWSKSKHAQATESLAKAVPPRLADPECLSCHVTGWSPQEFLPYEGGFKSLAETPRLAGNGCENCHGPGAAHVAAETGKDLVLRGQWRETMKLSKATAENQQCAKCHDADNSPEFGHKGFDYYWSKIEHKGTR